MPIEDLNDDQYLDDIFGLFAGGRVPPRGDVAAVLHRLADNILGAIEPVAVRREPNGESFYREVADLLKEYPDGLPKPRNPL